MKQLDADSERSNAIPKMLFRTVVFLLAGGIVGIPGVLQAQESQIVEIQPGGVSIFDNTASFTFQNKFQLNSFYKSLPIGRTIYANQFLTLELNYEEGDGIGAFADVKIGSRIIFTVFGDVDSGEITSIRSFDPDLLYDGKSIIGKSIYAFQADTSKCDYGLEMICEGINPGVIAIVDWKSLEECPAPKDKILSPCWKIGAIEVRRY